MFNSSRPAPWPHNGEIVGYITPRRGAPIPVFRGYHTHRTIYQQPHGKRECARRQRQIAEGRLTAANGLEA